MLRTLSGSAGRYLVGSPGGRPPLAKPPRAASAVAPLPASGPGSRAAPVSSPASAGGGYMAAAAEEDEAGDSPCGSAGSGARLSSKPVCIPGRGGDGFESASAGRGRRLRSSGDLWALHHAAAMHKPLSAPAVSHMSAPAAGPAARAGGTATAVSAAAGTPGASRLGASPAGEEASEPAPSPPPARLPILPGTVDSESSGSAASSLYPTSCSPQLPFAFTPSAQSLASYGARGGGGVLQEGARQGAGLDRASPRLGRTPPGAPGSGSGSGTPGVPHQAAMLQMRALSVGGGSGGSTAPAPAVGPSGFSPGSGGSGGVTAREVPASTALIRRTSWSSRSSYGPLGGEASQAGVGYSGALLAGLLDTARAARACIGPPLSSSPAARITTCAAAAAARSACSPGAARLPLGARLSACPNPARSCCAVSPMQDPALESMLSGSTPRQYSLAAGGLPSPVAAAAGQLHPAGGTLPRHSAGGAAGHGTAGAPPLLTFPSHSPQLSGGLDEAGGLGACRVLGADDGAKSLESRLRRAALRVQLCIRVLAHPGPRGIEPPRPRVHSLADTLPFALDEGSASPFKQSSPAQPSQQQPGLPGSARPASTGAGGPPAAQAPAVASRPGGVPSAAAAAAMDTDAAVGAFVRLIQEAPPLRLHAAVRGSTPARAVSAEFAAPAPGLLGTSSGSDSSAATCLSDGRGLTLQAGLRQVSAIRERLAQRGVLVGPCPAEV